MLVVVIPQPVTAQSSDGEEHPLILPSGSHPGAVVQVLPVHEAPLSIQPEGYGAQVAAQFVFLHGSILLLSSKPWIH